MKLKHLTFPGYVYGQSGVQGFFGEGDEYPHHKLYKLIPGFSFEEMVFVAKTTSWEPRIYPVASNTPLKDGYKLKQWFPKSIWWSIVSVISGYLLNAMGIPTPGAMYLLYLNKWQQRNDAFQLSFMAMGATLEEKLEETEQWCKYLLKKLSPFTYIYGIQQNVSCPNTGEEQHEALREWIALAQCYKKYLPTVPLIFKLDLMASPEVVSELQKHCDAICMGNTLAFGKLPEKMEWKELFRNLVSPIAKIFGEKFQRGLSGKPLFPLLVEWLERMEQYDPSVVIIAGGGIMKKKHIKRLAQFKCVHGIALGSVAILRPWRLQGLIKYGNKIFSQKNENK